MPMRNERKVEEALAVVLGNTGRNRRPNDLVTISKWLQFLQTELGSLSHVAERVGISRKMLSQFQSVLDLSPKVKPLVKRRLIDSVDVVAHLSQLSHADQIKTANAIIEDGLSSYDVRAIVELKMKSPELSIESAINDVLESRNIIEYVAQIANAPRLPEKTLRDRIARVLPTHTIKQVKVEGGVLSIIMTPEGKDVLAKLAKERRLTKRETLECIVRQMEGRV